MSGCVNCFQNRVLLKKSQSQFMLQGLYARITKLEEQVLVDPNLFAQKELEKYRIQLQAMIEYDNSLQENIDSWQRLNRGENNGN